MERKKLSGKEVRYLLKQNSVNLSWLSEQLGISAQALQERLKAQEFKSGYLLEIANVLGKDIFGKPVLNLAMGSHHIYFIASRSSNPTLNTTDKTITFSKVSDTFWKDYEVNVVSTSNGNRAVTLDRMVSMIQMTIDDAIKEGTTTFNITPHTWYYGFNYTTGVPVASTTDQVISISCPPSNIGQTGRFLTAYTISSATEWTTNITIAATDGTNTIGTATIYDAPFKRNKWKPYHGPLFGANGEMTIGLNSTWEVYEEGTW